MWYKICLECTASSPLLERELMHGHSQLGSFLMSAFLTLLQHGDIHSNHLWMIDSSWRAQIHSLCTRECPKGVEGLIISVCCINWPVSQNSTYLSAQTDVANLLLCAHCVARFTCLVTKSHIPSLEMASRYSKKPQMWLIRAATQASGSRYLSNPYSHDTGMGSHATTSRRIGIFSPSDA